MTTDVAQLAQEIGRLIGTSELQLRAMTMGTSDSCTYLVTDGHKQLVAKVNSSPTALNCVEHNLSRLSELGIPVPEVVAFDTSFDNVDYSVLVMTYIEGEELFFELDGMSDKQMTMLAEQITEFQRAASTLPVLGGCGYACVDAPADRKWSEVVRDPKGAFFVDPLPADVESLYERLELAIDKLAPRLDSITPKCFLHDLTTKNVLMKGGELQGVVDFDVVAYGDPLFHLGLAAATVHADLQETSHFYVDELTRLRNPSNEELAYSKLYEAVFLVSQLGAEAPDEPGEWRERAAKFADASLTVVERTFTI